MSKSWKLWTIACVFFIAVTKSGVDAQEPLTQTISTNGGVLTLRYPAEWQAEVPLGQILLTNGAVAPSELNPTNLTSGVIRVAVAVWRFEDLGIASDATFEEAVFELGVSILDDTQRNSVPAPVTDTTEINGVQAQSFTWTQDDFELYSLLLDIGEGLVLSVDAVALTGDMLSFIPTLETIAASVSYNPPVSSVTGAVIWQQVGIAYETRDSISDIGGLAVGPDDTLYIADASNGIAVFDGDGNFQNFVAGVWDGFTDDVAIALDGTLWVVSGDQQVYQIDIEGNLLNSWGDAGSEPGQFGEDSPTQIEVTSAGEIVTLDTNSNGARVQIWSADGQLLNEFALAAEVAQNFADGVMTVAPDGTLLREQIGAANLNDDSFSGEVTALTTRPDGSLLVATSYGDGSIYEFDAEGNYLREFGASPFEVDEDEEVFFEAGTFYAPQGLGVLSNGNVVVSDTDHDYWQIVRFTFEE